MRRRSRWRPVRSVAVLVLAVLAGCGFRDLRRNLAHAERYAMLRGTVSAPVGMDDPVIVFVYRGDRGHEQIVDAFALARPGRYFFPLPAGSYRLGAFADPDGDFTLGPDAPSALYDDGAPLALAEGEVRTGVDFAVVEPGHVPFPVSASPEGAGLPGVPIRTLGEVTTLSDARFSQANADAGLWRPVDFLFDVGAGIYFLEPYDEQKIPVLFVHGALGHPGVWAYLIDHLDRDRFQPWLAYYPTAADLQLVGEALDRWMQALYARYGFERYVVVAHSMGGLVARSFINHAVGDEAGLDGPDLFVTISTPWAGHAAAEMGVKQAPVVAPSWRNLAPGSPFLTALLAKPLPPSVPYLLLFTYGGRGARFGAATDGAVTLASQLEPRAQEQAEYLYGIDATHQAVLTDGRTAARLNQALRELAGP